MLLDNSQGLKQSFYLEIHNLSPRGHVPRNNSDRVVEGWKCMSPSTG